MSSIQVPLKTRRVGQRCTLNLSRAETWCGVATPTLTRFSNLTRFSIRPFFSLFFSITETQVESVPDLEEIGNVIEEVVDLASQINSEVDSDDAQELLDSHYQER
ncbi:hypothetical protein TNCV_48421 [Trichonephila clavipes]|nr:hypothetical protein TNCV_48421 [Trichonephila clavipes]